MTYKTTKTVEVEEVVKPSDIYHQGKEAVKKALGTLRVIDFRIINYEKDRYLAQATLNVEGPFPRSPIALSLDPRFVVEAPVTTPDFPEWE